MGFNSAFKGLKLFVIINGFKVLGQLLFAITRQAVYVYRNIEARSCNHCCGEKAIIIITQPVCVYL